MCVCVRFGRCERAFESIKVSGMCDFIHAGGCLIFCLHMYTFVCIYQSRCVPTCAFVFVCLCLLCGTSSACSVSFSQAGNKAALSAIKVKEDSCQRHISGHIRLSAVNPPTHNSARNTLAHSLAASSSSSSCRTSHCSKNLRRGSFGWRCLPPTRATLTFESIEKRGRGR